MKPDPFVTPVFALFAFMSAGYMMVWMAQEYMDFISGARYDL